MVQVITRKAFRNGVEGIVRAGREITVSTNRAADLDRLGLVTYAVGAKMQPSVKNKMVKEADNNKGRDAGGQEASPSMVPTEAPVTEPVIPSPTRRSRTKAGSSQESRSGGRTGGEFASQSSSRQGRRRKK